MIKIDYNKMQEENDHEEHIEDKGFIEERPLKKEDSNLIDLSKYQTDSLRNKENKKPYSVFFCLRDDEPSVKKILKEIKDDDQEEEPFDPKKAHKFKPLKNKKDKNSENSNFWIRAIFAAGIITTAYFGIDTGMFNKTENPEYIKLDVKNKEDKQEKIIYKNDPKDISEILRSEKKISGKIDNLYLRLEIIETKDKEYQKDIRVIETMLENSRKEDKKDKKYIDQISASLEEAHERLYDLEKRVSDIEKSNIQKTETNTAADVKKYSSDPKKKLSRKEELYNLLCSP